MTTGVFRYNDIGDIKQAYFLHAHLWDTPIFWIIKKKID